MPYLVVWKAVLYEQCQPWSRSGGDGDVRTAGMITMISPAILKFIACSLYIKS